MASSSPLYKDSRETSRDLYGNDYYYSALYRPDGENRWRCFHCSDPFLVQELVAKLQERYLLQQRIG